MYTGDNHTFVICAYKDNPHIESTIKSLEQQTIKSRIILSTSTPSEYLKVICEKHNIRMVVNKHPHLAGDDWNYGYMSADTELVTIAHQDDYYEPNFLENTLCKLNDYKRDDAILVFTDYYELKMGRKEVANTILRIKRIINFPLRFDYLCNRVFIKRRTLSVGCAICCPAVTYVKKNAGDNIFDTTYKNSCDYKTWVDLANKKGAFLYVKEKLLGHRIYAESATTLNLNENIRKKEDYEIMCNFWPRVIAKLINFVYAISEKSNVVETKKNEN